MASEALKIAMAELTASGDAPALAPSKLGTKDHWDSVNPTFPLKFPLFTFFFLNSCEKIRTED